MRDVMVARALVIDSDPIWLRLVERALSCYGFESVAAAASFSMALGRLTGRENVVVTEVLVAHETCFSFVRHVAEHSSTAFVIAMSDRAPRPHVFNLRACGVNAYIEKPFTVAALHHCLSRLHQAELGVERLESRVSRRSLPEAHDPGQTLESFRARFGYTNAELEVLRCILRGMRRVDIARERCTSVNTVKTQVRSLLVKSGAGNLREIIQEVVHDMRQRAGNGLSAGP